MASKVIPSTMRKLIAQRPSQKFREVVEMVTVPTPKPGNGEVLVKNRLCCILELSKINKINSKIR